MFVKRKISGHKILFLGTGLDLDRLKWLDVLRMPTVRLPGCTLLSEAGTGCKIVRGSQSMTSQRALTGGLADVGAVRQLSCGLQDAPNRGAKAVGVIRSASRLNRSQCQGRVSFKCICAIHRSIPH